MGDAYHHLGAAANRGGGRIEGEGDKKAFRTHYCLNVAASHIDLAPGGEGAPVLTGENGRGVGR